MNSTEDYIDKLIKKFFDVTISNDEMKYLYSYFLKLKTIPEKWKIEGIIIQEFAIKHYCFTHKEEFENQFARWIKEEQQQKNKRILKYTYRIAASILILLTVATGIYFVADNNSPQHNQYAQTNTIPTQSVPQPTHRQDHKPATITDNEIKNSADHTTNKYNHTGYTENKHSNGTCDIRTIKEYEVKDNSSTSNLLNINAYVRDSSNILLAQSATDGDTAMLTMVHNQYKADTNNIGIITYCNINCESNNIASMMINILST